MTFASDISGVLAAGDWIYASGDSNKEFAYEVASVSTVTATLYLPYKGDQAGSGRTMYNMQDNPLWNTAAGDFQWNFDTDDNWKVQGLHIRGTDANGNVEIDSSFAHSFIDCIFQGNGTTDGGISFTDDTSAIYCRKSRFFGHVTALPLAGDTWGTNIFRECLFDGNNVASSEIRAGLGGSAGTFKFIYIDCEAINYADALFATNGLYGLYLIRNLTTSETISTSEANTIGSTIQIEDDSNTVGVNKYRSHGPGDLSDRVIVESETTTVRSGGSNKSIKVTPTTNMSLVSGWEFNKLLVFEIPIYTTTDSKQYDIYFRPNTTAEWTTDPTASELWIELEAWGHATNNFRKITKSTGVIDMNGSTAWQALSVTVAPAQAGVAYLRCWYAKTKEAGANVFFVDPIPVIT